ncbi:patatin-like phospholipase family protein [Kitasatospora sp. RB6PN24]|uniref:patatin-like phospholipase family protein n=1 Tax=Kitasatospora humi TaxID=2893891 RepID=UPI001E56E05E|nr:patatin-like phospholipase family protein [Kitasatospora humi]MCC9311332.1 patatin-like phospholipase family protein [Kitasatospora humi]
MNAIDRALVLGPGGQVGAAWTAGLLVGLRRTGLRLEEADLVVGTSAGAIVAGMLLAGRDLELFDTPPSGSGPQGRLDGSRLGEVFAVLGTPGQDPAEARRRVGAIALATADPELEQALIAGRRALIGTDDWPEQRLLIPAVAAADGEPVVWDRDCGVPLARAVAAGSAFPGTAPPVSVDGRHYLDGALRAGSNTDLAAGARRLVAIEPMAHQYPSAAAGSASAVSVGPDEESVRAFGANPMDPAAQVPAYRAGLRQAADVAERVRAVWESEHLGI